VFSSAPVQETIKLRKDTLPLPVRPTVPLVKSHYLRYELWALTNTHAFTGFDVERYVVENLRPILMTG